MKPSTGSGQGPSTGPAAAAEGGDGSVLSYLRRAVDFLAERGVDNARLDAEVLLADLLGVDRVGVYLNFDRPLSPAEVAGYRESIRRRGKREPLQHIRGRQEFFSRDFRVDRRVLVPRPETELVVEEALSIAREVGSPRVLDLGTGSGVIAITLALELATAEVFAGDLSSEALAVAAENAARLGVADRVRFGEGDLAAAFEGERFDLVVSNPPYIAAAELATLAPELRDFEPRLALDGGVDGLEVYRRIAAALGLVLSPGGACVLELGAGQRERVTEIFAERGFAVANVRRDLAGIERVLTVRSR
jgi:release factor glutamine methyltransferase